MNQPAVIFVHRGESWYLYYTVKQARKWNPRAPIFVISDSPQADLRQYATVVNLEDYASDACEFSKSYCHNSVNTPEFERFCFQRWFIIREFISKCGIKSFAHIDSDVLVYTDLAAEFDRFGAFDVATVGSQGPQSMLVANADFVEGLCQRIRRMFLEETGELAAMYSEWRKTTDNTAVSDMHAIHTFLTTSKMRRIDLSVQHEQSVYDGVIHDSEGYEVNREIKRLIWKDRQPWGTRTDTGELVRFNTLHCQGPSKYHIIRQFNARDLRYYCDRLSARLRSGHLWNGAA